MEKRIAMVVIVLVMSGCSSAIELPISLEDDRDSFNRSPCACAEIKPVWEPGDRERLMRELVLESQTDV